MTTPDAPARPAAIGYAALLRGNANFRNLWGGQIVSLLGDWFNMIATATLIATLTGSGAAIGALFAVRMVAPFVVSPIAGVCADRFDRKTLLIASDVLRAAVVLCFLFVREPGDVWLLYVLTFVQFALSGFFYPARNAILPDIVARENLGTANALSGATWSTMLAVGAAIGGVFTGTFGLRAAFLVDAATFLVSALIIARVKPGRRGGVSGGASGALTQYLDGWRYLARHAHVFVVALHKAANGLIVASGFFVVQLVISTEVHVIGTDGSTGYGFMYAMVGLGTGLGPLIARRFTRDDDRKLSNAIGLSYIICAVGLVTVATSESFAVVLAGCFLRGVGSGIGWVFSTQLLLHLLPDSVRGRVFSTEFALLTLLSAGGSYATGVALDYALWSDVLLVLSIIVLLPTVLWFAWLRGQSTPGSGTIQ